MGMYDELRCKYPLPVEGATKLLFQTKDTPVQFTDLYEIRADGTLWHQEYDLEDRSNPKAKGIRRLIGCMTRVNKRWRKVKDFTGEIRFYTGLGKYYSGWVEFSAYFVKSKLDNLQLIQHRPVDPEKEAQKAKELDEQISRLELKSPPAEATKAKPARKAAILRK
jgi:hypothetical protein